MSVQKIKVQLAVVRLLAAAERWSNQDPNTRSSQIGLIVETVGDDLEKFSAEECQEFALRLQEISSNLDRQFTHNLQTIHSKLDRFEKGLEG